jgi:hypothetical protein
VFWRRRRRRRVSCARQSTTFRFDDERAEESQGEGEGVGGSLIEPSFGCETKCMIESDRLGL